MSLQSNPLNTLSLAKNLRRLPAEHKGNAGKALLIGGAPGMAGALLLAGNACLHLGAGWTILEMLDPASAHAMMNSPELMIQLANPEPQAALVNLQPDLIAIGPGLGTSVQASEWLKATLAYPKIPLVIDADAINLIAQSPELLNALQARNQMFPGQSVLTPHPGEAAKLLHCTAEIIQIDRLSALEKLLSLTQSIIVLKGQHTLIASPGHSFQECQAGNPGMGTGGMGDALTGTIAAIAVQGVRHQLNLSQSTELAVQLHATAADSLVAKGIGPLGLTPSETILEMRRLLNQWAQE
ncbi:NAD(P)H-hydrate dehydratase [Polynucleobacter sp. MWH-Svant-W18]|uniref:NAD(P)H-hydrate dehydratase n=1 Tax=Polynucleobacter sp. MWH-Svant-W18 TaxID=1855909 RepID=UPI001BFDC6AB|nr:NAD(P)H-hydrate dehydratase [Polynucleobacter sp. MWH-Svant-W18]QWD78539.1 NAD(P)H-hydrate dehydratase [Polynucleobacter sp. MWH-Svant-W18]